jgi:glycerol-3-phosphate dehydrogenase (NAD(P)+)
MLPPGTPLLFLTKGLAGEGDRLELLPHRLRRQLRRRRQRSTPLFAVGGPSIAGELAAERDTAW